MARTASIPASIARAMSAADAVGGGNPSNGAALIAENPSATARFAAAANPSGVRGLVARLTLA
jgi:hypothetical protein